MLRGLGGLLILLGGLAARRARLEGERRRQRLRHALCETLEDMAEEIRLCLTPVPRLLRARDTRAGGFFGRAAAGLESGLSLPESWAEAARTLPLEEEERAALTAAGNALGGTEARASGALLLAAAQLRRTLEHSEARRMERERLTTAVCLCASALLWIILL